MVLVFQIKFFFIPKFLRLHKKRVNIWVLVNIGVIEVQHWLWKCQWDNKSYLFIHAVCSTVELTVKTFSMKFSTMALQIPSHTTCRVIHLAIDWILIYDLIRLESKSGLRYHTIKQKSL